MVPFLIKTSNSVDCATGCPWAKIKDETFNVKKPRRQKNARLIASIQRTRSCIVDLNLRLKFRGSRVSRHSGERMRPRMHCLAPSLEQGSWVQKRLGATLFWLRGWGQSHPGCVARQAMRLCDVRRQATDACQSHKLGNPCPLRDSRPNEGHGTIPIMRLVIRTGRIGATCCSDWGR